MKARIKSVKKLDDVTELTFSGDLPFAETFYTNEEYKVFRDKVLNLIKIEKLRYLIGLEFDWELVNGKPYPTKLILPENPIWVDFREPESISEALLPLSVRTGLKYGDYQFTGYGNTKICIERKEAGDLITSTINGHLAEQVNKMVKSVDVAILLIEGFLTSTSDGKVRTRTGISRITWAALWNSLMTLQLENGLALDFSPNNYFTPKRIKQAYNYFQKEEHTSNRREMRSYPSSLTDAEKLLCGFPGIDTIRSKQILKYFHSPITFLAAPKEEKLKVKSLGPVIVEKIDRILQSWN